MGVSRGVPDRQDGGEVGEEGDAWRPVLAPFSDDGRIRGAGETCEASKGSDADGKHAGVWAPASSWGLPEEREEAKSVCSVWREKGGKPATSATAACSPEDKQKVERGGPGQEEGPEGDRREFKPTSRQQS